VDRLDLVQLHWWDYDAAGYVDAAGWLDEQRRAGKIRHIGLTNFDQKRLSGNRRRRYPGRLAPGAVFRARPAARQQPRRTMPATASACSATARWLADFCRTATWKRRSGSPVENRSLVKCG
jgi:aryl-alcohol dehydrogenase-like predicted oxidoreductase